MAKLNTLPIGSLIEFGKYKVNAETPEKITWMIVDKNHAGYPANSVTLMTEKVIDYMAFDARELNNPQSDRQVRGNNRFVNSNIRQWLNKSGSGWYVPLHEYDSPPINSEIFYNEGEYNTRPGFLTYFTTNDLNNIKTTHVFTVTNPQFDTITEETISEKFFLPSYTELTGETPSVGMVVEGSKYPFFTSASTRIAYQSLQFHTYSLLKVRPSQITTQCNWWIRSADYTLAGNTMRITDNSGNISSIGSFTNNGIRPVCNVNDTLEVIPTGIANTYRVVYNLSPVVSPALSDLGDKIAPFIFSYTVTDSDSSTVSVVYKIDNIEIGRESSVVTNVSKSYTVSSSTYNNTPIGIHTISIIVTDVEDTVTATIKFNKVAEKGSIPISALPVGSQIRFGKHQVMSETPEPITWVIADKNHAGYPYNSITLVTNKIIDFKAIDAREPKHTDINIKGFGNNRYAHSNIRQWLNRSDLNWYVPHHSVDQAPDNANTGNYNTFYNTRAGFLTYFSLYEKSLLLYTQLISAKNTLTESGGSEILIDRMFLLSTTEVGLPDENSIAEGSKLPIFTDNTSRRVNASVQAFNNSGNTAKPGSQTTNGYWWLRTPEVTTGHQTRLINDTGALNPTGFAYNGGWGLRPTCNITNDIYVQYNESTNSYDIIPGTTNNIHVDTTELSEKDSAFNIYYVITDDTNSTVEVDIQVDDISVEPNNFVSINTINTFEINAIDFANLLLGNHTIKINAKHSEIDTSIITLYFTKIEKINTEPTNVISTPLYQRNDDGSYSLILPVTTIDEIYTDIGKNETLKMALNDLLIKPSALWTHTHRVGHDISALFYREGLVFTGSYNNEIKIFDNNTGQYKNNDFFFTNRITSMMTDVGNAHLYVAGYSISIIKYNYRENKIAWTFSHNSIAHCIDIGLDDCIYAALDNKLITKINPTGTEIWSHTMTSAVKIVTVDTDNTVLCADRNGILQKLNSDGTVFKTIDMEYEIRDIKLDGKGYLYTGGKAGLLQKLNTSDLSVIWEIGINDFSEIHSISLTYDNKIYVMGTDNIYVYNDDGSLFYKFILDVTPTSMTIDSENHIIIGTSTGEIIKYSLNRFNAFAKTTKITGYTILPSDWVKTSVVPIGDVYICSIYSKAISPTSTVNINISDIPSLYYANAANVKSIAEERQGEVVIYANNIPTNLINTDIIISNY